MRRFTRHFPAHGRLRPRPATAAVSVALIGALLGACTTQAPSSTTDGASGTGDAASVKTGPGVTDDTIRVGMLMDLSGPFAAGSAPQVTEAKAFIEQLNADGGVCKRKVELDVQDHAYDPQKAVTLYRSMKPNVVAVLSIVGSPTTAAVLPLAESDDVYIGGQWASVVLGHRNVQVPGTTYSIEGASAVDVLVDELKVPKGSKIGVVYFVGDYGSDSLKGATHAAKERGLEIVPQEITPRDTDLTAQASALKRAGVKGVVLAAAPGQLASLAGVMSSQGMSVPIVGNTVTWNASVLTTPASAAILKSSYTITSVAPYGHDAAGAKQARDLYEKAAPDALKGWEVVAAYVNSRLLIHALENACTSGDLTPSGVLAGMRQGSLDLEGATAAPLDLSKGPAQPPTRTVFLSKADKSAPGGLTVQKTLEGPSAKSYTFPGS